MKIGDLVVYNNPCWADWFGIVVRQIPGTDERQVIHWIDGSGLDDNCMSSHPRRELEVISENR